MHPEFKPRVIGIDNKTISQILDLYKEITIATDALKFELGFIFKESDSIDISFLMEFINSTDPETLIRQKWISFNKISFPGVNMEKFAKSDFLDIPKYEETLQLHEDLKTLFKQVKVLKFEFPLMDLYNQKENCFEVTEDLKAKLLNQFTTTTQNEKENQVLEAFDQLKNSINTLCNLGYIRPNNLRVIGDRFHGHILIRTREDKDPFELSRTMFRSIKEIGLSFSDEV